MDVRKGHCWRCEKALAKPWVVCRGCPLAEYCSVDCRQQDRVRHGSVECQVFGPKRCNQCGKTDNMKECAGCNNAWYCNAACQQRNWPAHKEQCNATKHYIRSATARLGALHVFQGNNVSQHPEPPVYVGNTLATDFLHLEGNEWSELADVAEEELKRDYYVLSTGCGDLRNTVLTVASLPSKYLGRLHVTLDDFDPFVMARNVMFLVMMVRYETRDGIASSLATIWYSVLISDSDYDLLKAVLQELVQVDREGLHTLTQGLVSVSEDDLRYLREVWEGWLELKCQRNMGNSIKLHEQRKTAFANDMDAAIGLPQYLNRLSSRDAKFMKHWYDHGLFLPQDKHLGIGCLLFDNPTLTGRKSPNVSITTPKEYLFEYCVRTDQSPFKVWDCLRVDEFAEGHLSSPMVRYHAYVTSLLQQTINFISQKRLTVGIFLANCLDFPNHHLTLAMPTYDRIFTSNLMDFIGFCTLLRVFKPLLNRSNKHSCIVTQTLNWIYRHTPQADVQKLPPHEGLKYSTMCRQDTGFGLMLSLDINNHREYYDNTHWFLAYLRAEVKAGGVGIPAMNHIPKLNEVMRFHGMRMRDFRKQRNRLAPFQYRVNARKITMMDGHDRNVEWCLAEHTE